MEYFPVYTKQKMSELRENNGTSQSSLSNSKSGKILILFYPLNAKEKVLTVTCISLLAYNFKFHYI